jgi:beta-1,4-N-acetylglucosaminyltransferase
MKILYVCSHGGHFTELNLISGFSGDDVLLISYRSPRTEAFAGRKYLFDNFGQKPWKFPFFLPSILKILLKEKPDAIISNGAEIAAPFMMLARFMGIKTLFIECYTRIDTPTITGRIVYPFSNEFIVLWPEMLKKYGPKAKYIGGMIVPIEQTDPQDLAPLGKHIFVMVGMHFSGFDRLIKEIDRIALERNIHFIAQIGHSSYEPKHIEFFRFLESDDEIESLIINSSLIITHGGISVVEGLIHGKPTIAVPRLRQFREHMNDHQLWFTKRLADEGLIIAITEIGELGNAIDNVLAKGSRRVKPNPVIRAYLSAFLKDAKKGNLDMAK